MCFHAFRRFENEPWVAFHCNAFQARYFFDPTNHFPLPPQEIKKGLERVKTMLESTWRFFWGGGGGKPPGSREHQVMRRQTIQPNLPMCSLRCSKKVLTRGPHPSSGNTSDEEPCILIQAAFMSISHISHY